MSNDIDIENLASLARIEMSNEEKEEIRKDLESIVAYVKKVQEVSVDSNSENNVGKKHNVVRDDENPHESGAYTKDLMDNAPRTKEVDGEEYIVVKNILS